MELIDLQNWFIDSELSLAVAESCSGGMISSIVTSQAGSSGYFLGGLIAYQNSIKENWLEVSTEIIESEGVVSEEVAVAMAEGCSERFQSDWAISTTGFLGPQPDPNMPGIGTVCFGLVSPEDSLYITKIFPEQSRWEMQQAIALFALQFLWENRDG